MIECKRVPREVALRWHCGSRAARSNHGIPGTAECTRRCHRRHSAPPRCAPLHAHARLRRALRCPLRTRLSKAARLMLPKSQMQLARALCSLRASIADAAVRRWEHGSANGNAQQASPISSCRRSRRAAACVCIAQSRFPQVRFSALSPHLPLAATSHSSPAVRISPQSRAMSSKGSGKKKSKSGAAPSVAAPAGDDIDMTSAAAAADEASDSVGEFVPSTKIGSYLSQNYNVELESKKVPGFICGRQCNMDAVREISNRNSRSCRKPSHCADRIAAGCVCAAHSQNAIASIL